MSARTRLVEPFARPPQRLSGHPDAIQGAFQDAFELRRIPELSGRDHDRHGPLALLDREMEPGGHTAGVNARGRGPSGSDSTRPGGSFWRFPGPRSPTPRIPATISSPAEDLGKAAS